MAGQTVIGGSIDPNPGTEDVTHCPKCGQLFVDDPDFEGKCPFCGYLFEDED